MLGASTLIAAPLETELIAAGPVRIPVPKAFVKGAVMEKVAFAPLYSAEAWAEKKRDPMMLLKPSYINRPQHWAIRLPKAAQDS